MILRRRHYNLVKLENVMELKHFKHRVAGNCITNSTLQHEISVDIKQRRGSPTTPSCSTPSKTPKHPMQKHKADKHKKRPARDKERQRTTQKHQTQRTTHKPTRPMGNRCRLRTAICHGNSRRYGYPGLPAHNPPIFQITQRSRRTYNCGVKQPPHCQMITHKQDRKTQGPKQYR